MAVNMIYNSKSVQAPIENQFLMCHCLAAVVLKKCLVLYDGSGYHHLTSVRVTRQKFMNFHKKMCLAFLKQKNVPILYGTKNLDFI